MKIKKVKFLFPHFGWLIILFGLATLFIVVQLGIYTSSQAYPVIWSGSCKTNWDVSKQQLVAHCGDTNLIVNDTTVVNVFQIALGDKHKRMHPTSGLGPLPNVNCQKTKGQFDGVVKWKCTV